MTGVDIRIVDKAYRSTGHSPVATLRDLRLTVPAGQFLCLVGPSGCGKSTLLNIVAGLDPDFVGAITVEARTAVPRIGYVFQQPRLLPWRTVRENILLALPADTDGAYVEHLFDTVGLGESLDVYPGHLSVGMSRRAALVRAFAANPDLLLMDEPFVSLDPPTARRVRELLVGLWRERPHTVLFVTHDLREAIELGDRIVFLAGRPASVVGDIGVTLARTERSEILVEDFRRRLHADHPQLASLL